MNTSFLIERQKDLMENPSARIPVCLCLDTSGSMGGAPIAELNEGVKIFYDAIKADDKAQVSAEISIVTFGDGGVSCPADFAGVNLVPEPPQLTAGGMTPMGEAVNMALDMLEKRKQEYRRGGVDYYQPWLVLMTDGCPNGDEGELRRAERRTVELADKRKLTVFPIGIGSNADMSTLQRFSPNRPPLRLKGLNFKEFFTWLSQSVSIVSASSPGDTGVKLDTSAITGWGEL